MKAQIICQEAHDFMSNLITSTTLPLTHEKRMPAVFTSLPDADEMGICLGDWEYWFEQTVATVMHYTDRNGYLVLYQTDRKHDGGLISKADIIMRGARTVGANVVFHKIAVTHKGTNLFRPGYSHIIALSFKGTSGRATPDVFPAGPKVYKNATGMYACNVVFDFLLAKGISVVYDLFCGQGSIGHTGERRGFTTINVDIDPDQVAKATKLIQSAADE